MSLALCLLGLAPDCLRVSVSQVDLSYRAMHVAHSSACPSVKTTLNWHRFPLKATVSSVLPRKELRKPWPDILPTASLHLCDSSTEAVSNSSKAAWVAEVCAAIYLGSQVGFTSLSFKAAFLHPSLTALSCSHSHSFLTNLLILSSLVPCPSSSMQIFPV